MQVAIVAVACLVPFATEEVEPAGEAQIVAAVTAGRDDCGRRRVKEDGSAWVCSFVDKFDGTTLDVGKWTAQETALTGITNGTNGCYVAADRTIHVAGGRLRLVARRHGRRFVCQSPLGAFRTRFAAAALTTRGWFSQAYGRFAFRAKFPTARVAGVHAALWLYPDDTAYGAWPRSGEVDVAEWYSALPRRVFPSVHYVDGGTNVHTGQDARFGDASKFHTYALEWNPTTMRFYYDGELTYQHAWDPAAPLVNPQPFDQPFNVVLSQVWGGSWNAPTRRTPNRNRLVVDWVKVWV